MASPNDVNNSHRDVVNKMGVIAEYLFLVSYEQQSQCMFG